MRLRTLGGVALDPVTFTRPKPLLLLCYLALEGRRARRDVAALFWPGSDDPMKALTVTLARLRRGAPGAVGADRERVWTGVACDATRFLALARAERHDAALALYTGPFLAGFHLPGIGSELEEWLYRTRELLAGHARRSHLALASRCSERGERATAATHAESAVGIEGAGPLEDDELRRLHALLRSHESPLTQRLQEEASSLGVSLPDWAARPEGGTGRDPLAFLRRHEQALEGAERQQQAIEAIDAALPEVLRAWREAVAAAATDALWYACRPLQLFFVQRGAMAPVAAAAFADAAAALSDHADAEAGTTALVGRLHAAEAWFRFRADDIERSTVAAERALALLGRVEPSNTTPERARTLQRARISAHNTLANVAKHRGDLRSAERHLAAALERARATNDDAQLAIVTNNLALVARASGRYRDAERLLGEALVHNRRRDNQRSVARNLTNLGGVLVSDGRPREAEVRLCEALELAEHSGYRALVPDLLAASGRAAQALGEHERARGLYHQALDGALARGDRTLSAYARCRLGHVETALGDHASARAHLREALESALAIGASSVIASALLGLACERLASGDAVVAATVAGALERHGSLEPNEAACHAALLRRLRGTLGTRALDTALQRGGSYPPEQLLDEAAFASRDIKRRAARSPTRS